MRVILASASPRRKELMGLLQIPFEIIVADVEEKITKKDPGEVVKELSMQKAEAVLEKLEQEKVCVIGADTVVAIDGMILGKPKSEEDAFSMLRMLSGKAHQVYTGVTILKKDKLLEKSEEAVVEKKNFFVKTEVIFAELSDEEIKEYIATKEPMDKAGSYGIQGFGSKFITEIQGDYFNVVGLPVSAVYKELKDFL